MLAGLRTVAGHVAAAAWAVDDADRVSLTGDVAVTTLAQEVARRVLIAGLEATATGRAVELTQRTPVAIVEAVATGAGVVAGRVLVAVELAPSTAAVESAVGLIQALDLAAALRAVELAGLRAAMAVACAKVRSVFLPHDVVGAANEGEPCQQDQPGHDTVAPENGGAVTVDAHVDLHESDDSFYRVIDARRIANLTKVSGVTEV